MTRTTLILIVVLALAFGAATGAVANGDSSGPPAVQQAELLGQSVLDALTLRDGSEPSGFVVPSANGIVMPLPAQPVQGFSDLHAVGDGTYLAMSDNGYGTKANSFDFLLFVHHIQPDFATGDMAVLGGFGLSDPDHHYPGTLWRDGGCAAAAAAGTLPAGYTCPAPDRQLTGADLDPESMERAPDGTFWFGDEFGPYIFHTDAEGRMLDAPISIPGVRSPSSPELAPGEAPTHPGSRGFEGLAIAPNGRTLFALFEGPVAEDTAAGLGSDLRIVEVRLRRGGAEFTGQFWRYRREHPGNSIGDMIAIDEHRFLVIERDTAAGTAARFKATFLIDRRDRDNDGYVDKQLLVNLLAVPNPASVNGIPDAFFTFPFETIEGVEILDDHTIAVAADNNFPNGGGRVVGVADPNEIILIRLDQDLDVARRLLPG
jgi:hypothetical protein